MSQPLRVHTLAKELGVASKAIIAKCEAEGIVLKNHMAVISAGLAESIREWFSGGQDVTSVEESAAVDLDAARRTARRAKAKHERDDDEGAQDDGSVATAIEEGETREKLPDERPSVEPVPSIAEFVTPPSIVAPAEPVAAPAPERIVQLPAAAEPLIAEPEPIAATIVPEAQPPAPVAPPSPPEVKAAPVPPPAPPRVEVPPPPAEPVRPAGPQVVPKPAVLQGPRVVRVEAPEHVSAPRARVGPPGPRPPGAGPAAVPGAAPRRGRGKGRRDESEEARARARNPRRHDTTTTEFDSRLREWRDQDLLERKERLASVTGHGLRDRRAAERRRQVTPGSAGAQSSGGRRDGILLITPIALKDFCAAVGTPFATVSKKLMEQTGRLWMINQSLDGDLAELIAMELGVPVEIAKARTAYEKLEDEFEDRPREHLKPRPPVVAMLGHVDHGKTSLLDAIRKTSVAAGEAGGITQHIGAYRVKRGDWDVTFIDTPGHQAFTAMRARGATLTDVVVLVVAADDGVMPQTIEAMNHAKAAGVTIVVALNKIDMPGVDVNRVLGQLSEQELTPSEWGGNIDVIRTSATKGTGVDELVTHLSTLSELLDLKADSTVPAQGVVIEAEMREGQGVVAEILVKEGTLRPGQFVVCGPAFGRVRSLADDRGRSVRDATPGSPVALSGLNELPLAGDRLFQVDSLRQAEEIAEEVRQQRRTESLQSASKPRTLESLLAGAADGEIPELNVIIKCDVSGSIEVLKKTLGDVPASKARLKILHIAVGAVSEADVHLAKASNAMILGFHVVPEDRARQLADQLGVEVRTYRIIYELMDDLTKALQGLLEPIKKEEIRATVEVRQVFNVSKIGTVAGCYVTDGVVNRNHRIRLVRDGRVIVESTGLASLKRFKDDAREVRAGFECGVKLDGYDDIKPGDVLQALEVVEIAQEL